MRSRDIQEAFIIVTRHARDNLLLIERPYCLVVDGFTKEPSWNDINGSIVVGNSQSVKFWITPNGTIHYAFVSSYVDVSSLY